MHSATIFVHFIVSLWRTTFNSLKVFFDLLFCLFLSAFALLLAIFSTFVFLLDVIYLWHI